MLRQHSPSRASCWRGNGCLEGLPELVGSFYDNPLLYADFFTARLTAIKVLGEYVWLLLWPGRLSCDYSYNQVPVATWTLSGREDWKTVAAVATCLAAIALAIVCYRRRKTVCFLIAMAFACIAPTANLAILIGTIMAERFLYLPAIGFAGCVVLGVYGLCDWLQTRPYAAPAILGVLCAAYAVRTYVRNFDWMNEGSLWASAASASPDSYKPHRALITWFATTNSMDPKQAVREAERALAILDSLSDERSSAETYAIAGTVYRRRGDEADPAGNPAAWYAKALRTLQRGQKVDLANTHEIVRRNRERGKTVTFAGYAPLYLELGRTYLRLGDPQHAAEALEYGRSVRPDPDFSDELANAYRAMDNPRRSAIALMEGLMLDPGEVAFASKLVALYKEAEPDSCAVAGSAGGASINLGCPLVHDQLCTAAQGVFRLQTRTGRRQEAARTVQSTIREMGCPAEAFR